MAEAQWQVEEPTDMWAHYFGRNSPEERFGECRALINEDIEVVVRHRGGATEAYGCLLRLSTQDALVSVLAECEAYLWGERQEYPEFSEWAEGGIARALHERVKAALAKAGAKG